MKVRYPVLVALLFLLPNLLGFVVFTAGPVVFSLVASLTNWNLQEPNTTSFVWGANYVELFHDKEFWLYLLNTIYFMLGIPVSIVGSLWLAILLNRKMKTQSLYRTILYLPSFTSGVALMILWKSLYNPDFGAINASLSAIFHTLGLHWDTPQWLLSTRNVAGLSVESVSLDKAQFGLGARDAMIYMGIWTSIGGSNMLLYLAALTNVPTELLESAQLDGAGRWRCFKSITWPQLAPTTFFIVIMSLIGGFQGGFEQARVMTSGGPAGTTTTLSYYIFSKAFEEFRMGYASSVSWVLFAIIFVLTALNWKYGQKGLTE
jgi:multiple sugar transport system permease protein